MKKIFFTSLTLIATGVAFTSCNSSNDTADKRDNHAILETAENVDRPKANYMHDYDTFKKESENRIDENDRKIDELEAEAKDAKKDVKADYKERIDAAKQKNKELRRRIDAYKDNKDESGEKWESFKREFNHDMDELGTSLKDLGRNNVK
jgi:peptidoglycan hydrolase CwlO-like protein